MKLISRNEAAEMLGVTPQTISNLATRGVIHEKKNARRSYYSLSEIEALGAFPELKRAEELREEIMKYEAEMEEKYAITSDIYNAKKDAFLRICGGRSNWGRYCQVVDAIMSVCCEDLTPRERGIVNMVLEMMPIEVIADRYGLQRERVRQIFMKALRKVMQYPSEVEMRISNAEEEVRRVLDENDKLRIENVRLQAMIKNPQVNMTDEEYEEQVRSLDLYGKVYPFNMKLRETNLSVRAINCCLVHDITTIGELVSFQKHEFMRMRNFGRKSLQELEEFLYKMKLDFNMWRDPLRDYDDPSYRKK